MQRLKNKGRKFVEHEIIISADGTLCAVYSDALRELFSALGVMEIDRATHVEFDITKQRWVIYSPNGNAWSCCLCFGAGVSYSSEDCMECNGSGVAAFDTREEALEYERLMLESHLSGFYDNPNYDPMDIRSVSYE